MHNSVNQYSELIRHLFIQRWKKRMHCSTKIRCGAFCSVLTRTSVLSLGHLSPTFHEEDEAGKQNMIWHSLISSMMFLILNRSGGWGRKTGLTVPAPDCCSSALMLYCSILKIVCNSCAMSPSVIFAKVSVFKSSWLINSLQMQSCGRTKKVSGHKWLRIFTVSGYKCYQIPTIFHCFSSTGRFLL